MGYDRNLEVIKKELAVFLELDLKADSFRFYKRINDFSRSIQIFLVELYSGFSKTYPDISRHREVFSRRISAN
jgi:hypothetical protein